MASAFDAVETVRSVLSILEQQLVVVELIEDVLDRGLSVAIGVRARFRAAGGVRSRRRSGRGERRGARDHRGARADEDELSEGARRGSARGRGAGRTARPAPVRGSRGEQPWQLTITSCSASATTLRKTS